MGETTGYQVMTHSTSGPDLRKVTRVSSELLASEGGSTLDAYLREARNYLMYYEWCEEVVEEYIGLHLAGVVAVFLFRILPSRPRIDEWIWVIVGDLPPTYLTCESCPNPAAALDGYIGAMSEWVEAASKGLSVAELIPVNVPATPENAERLRSRLELLDRHILANCKDDLHTSG